MDPVAVLSGGLALGAVYALTGVAVAVVAAAARTLLLAVGPILVAGVLVDLTLAAGAGLPAWAAAAAGLAAGAAVAALLEPLVLRPLPAGAPWLVGLAVAGIVLQGAVARWLSVATLRPDPVLDVAVAGLEPALAAAALFGLPAAGLLAAAVRHTGWGRRLRIVGGSHAAATAAGIIPGRVRAGALAVAGAAAVVAGLLGAPIAFVGISQGADLTARGLAAALVLGRPDPLWAVPGGLAVGLAEAAGQGLWPQAGGAVAVGLVVVVALLVRGPTVTRGWA